MKSSVLKKMLVVSWYEYHASHNMSIKASRFHVFPLIVVVDGAYRKGDDAGGDRHCDGSDKVNSAIDKLTNILILYTRFHSICCNR